MHMQSTDFWFHEMCRVLYEYGPFSPQVLAMLRCTLQERQLLIISQDLC